MTGPKDIPRYNCFEGELNKETDKFVWFKDYRELKSAADKLADKFESYRSFVNRVGVETDHTKRYGLMLQANELLEQALKEYRGEK